MYFYLLFHKYIIQIHGNYIANTKNVIFQTEIPLAIVV